MKTRTPTLFVLTALLAGCEATPADQDSTQRPLTVTRAGPRDPRARADALLRRAMVAGEADVDALRGELAGLRKERGLVESLGDEARQSADHSRALMATALIGELRGPYAAAQLRSVLALPLPPAGGDDDTPRAGVEILMAKAVQGLAYLREEASDAEVLRIAASHPSRVVRAEAIDAYLYNQPRGSSARGRLARLLQPEDLVFLDRPRRDSAASAVDFDRQLAAYLAAHPELTPPAPQQRVQP